MSRQLEIERQKEWAEEDLNLRSPKTASLQPAGVSRFPIHPYSKVLPLKKRKQEGSNLRWLSPNRALAMRYITTLSCFQKNEPARNRTQIYGVGNRYSTVELLTQNGSAGIRTPDAFRHNGFQDRHLQPLGHASINKNPASFGSGVSVPY